MKHSKGALDTTDFVLDILNHRFTETWLSKLSYMTD